LKIVLAIIFLIAFAFLSGLWFYRFLKNIFVLFGKNTVLWRFKAPLIASSVFLGFGSIAIVSTASIFILHVLVIGLLVQFINFAIRYFCKREIGLWNKIYLSGAVPVAVTIVILVYGYINMNNVVCTKYSIDTDKQIKSDGYTLAFISDVHFGVSLDQNELRQKCNEIESSCPDAVILGGDIVDNDTTKDDLYSAFQILGNIKSKYGVFFVYGNHDRPMPKIKSMYSNDELTDALSKSGIKVLKDEIYLINDELYIVGREDKNSKMMGYKRYSAHEILKDLSKNKFIVLCDHQPNDYKAVSKEGADLIVSGHTHGGQIFPSNLIQELFNINDDVYGKDRVGKHTYSIVTSGLAGWKYPIKTCAPSEYVIIKIK